MQRSDLTEDVAIGTEARLFLQTIKKTTAELHELLESNSLLSAIVDSNITVKQYYCYLILMKKVAEVYEERVLPRLAGALQGFEQTKASVLIAEDIQDIGYEPPHDNVLTDFILLKEMTVSFAFGFAYVMEGSKLGGKVIFKHIQRMLGFSEEHGAKFIADYGNNTGRVWKEFLSRFSQYVSKNNGEEAAIQGAEYAFTSIYCFFESNTVVYEN